MVMEVQRVAGSPVLVFLPDEGELATMKDVLGEDLIVSVHAWFQPSGECGSPYLGVKRVEKAMEGEKPT